MLLILTRRDDLAADYLITRLAELDRPYFRVNSDELVETVVSARFGGDESARIIRTAGAELSIEDVSCIWYRRAVRPPPSGRVAPDTRPFVRSETRHAIEGLVANDRVRWVNPMHATELSERKLYQLRLASEVGLKIPPTLVSNAPNELREFAAEHDRVICKPISQGLVPRGGDWYAVHTREVHASELADAEELTVCPTLLQRLVPKGVDVRVTIFGKEVFSVDIETPQTSPIDWRADPSQVTYRVSTVPDQVLQAARSLMARLDISFGAFDFIRSDEGEWQFLEVNPAGEWAWLEVQLGLPMRDALIRLLYG